MKILMTDDDSDDRLLAMIAFKSLNVAHSIDFVTNGQELAQKKSFNVQLASLIENQALPIKSSHEVIKVYRQAHTRVDELHS
jgi:hypothetical protein